MEYRITVKVGSETFAGCLYDSESSRKVVSDFPMTVSMDESGESEYFVPLCSRVPGSFDPYINIVPGDITICNNVSLTIFYDCVSGCTDYIKIGHINDPQRLKEALKKNAENVTFSIAR